MAHVTDVAKAKLATKYGGTKHYTDYLKSDWAPAQGLSGYPVFNAALSTFLTTQLTAMSQPTTGTFMERWRRYWDNVVL